jgi:hypothetical protein
MQTPDETELEGRAVLKAAKARMGDAHKWGARRWYDELRRLREQAIKHNPDLLRDDPKVEVHKAAGNPRVFLPGAPLVQLVGPQDRDIRIPRHLLPALIVNISAPEPVILAEFKRQLREALGKFPPPLRRPGPHAANYRFDAHIFERWRYVRIVELAALLAWNVKHGRSYRDIELGKWLGHRDKDETYRAKKTLKDAIAALPTLAAQIKYDTDPARKAENLKEAEGLLDPSDLKLAEQWAAEWAEE